MPITDSQWREFIIGTWMGLPPRKPRIPPVRRPVRVPIVPKVPTVPKVPADGARKDTLRFALVAGILLAVLGAIFFWISRALL